MTKAKQQFFGFGYKPEAGLHHFLVCIPGKKDDLSQIVYVYECFDEWSDNTKVKAKISKSKWKLLESAVRTEFNAFLKKQKLPLGRFVVGQTPLERLLGKELLVLVWAVEDCDPTVIPLAIRNWRGLAPEERWWLYTRTNATRGVVNDRRGWRKALYHVLCENG